MEKNAKNATIFYKEWKRTDAQPCMWPLLRTQFWFSLFWKGSQNVEKHIEKGLVLANYCLNKIILI